MCQRGCTGRIEAVLDVYKKENIEIPKSRLSSGTDTSKDSSNDSSTDPSTDSSNDSSTDPSMDSSNDSSADTSTE